MLILLYHAAILIRLNCNIFISIIPNIVIFLHKIHVQKN